MTASPEETARKVRQLDNDVQAIYTMLAGIEATQRRQANRLDELVEGQATLVEGQAALVEGQAAQDAKLDRILRRLEG